MWPFHRHRFIEVARTYAPPPGPTNPRPPVVINTWMEMAMVMGCTTILGRCECGKERTTRLLGHAVDADRLEQMARQRGPEGL